LENIAVPTFDPRRENHRDLAILSGRAHAAAQHNSHENVKLMEETIDELAAQIWSITPDELGAIREALGRT